MINLVLAWNANPPGHPRSMNAGHKIVKDLEGLKTVVRSGYSSRTKKELAALEKLVDKLFTEFGPKRRGRRKEGK